MQNKNPHPASPQKGHLAKTEFTGGSDIDLVAQTLSPQIALLLIEHFAGVELKVPKKMHQHHRISQCIGYDNACAISDYSGGGVLLIPVKKPTVIQNRNATIVKMIKAGVPHAKIAKHHNITTRHLRRIVGEIGLSGQTCAPRNPNNPVKPPKSKSNGGLTGGISVFTTPHPSKPQTPPDGAVCGKHGYYLPQTKMETK